MIKYPVTHGYGRREKWGELERKRRGGGGEREREREKEGEREKERERERREGGQGVMREFMGRDEGCSLLSGRVFR